MSTAVSSLTSSGNCSTRERDPTSVRERPRLQASSPRVIRPTVDLVPCGSVSHPVRSWMIMVQVQTEAKPIVNRTQALVWLRQMMLIRRFEERAEMLYQKGNKIGGFFHQYSGQEPVAVGSIGVLRENDYVITAYRDHGHALARGMSAKAAMAELLGKVTGCSKGKGGSMHFFDAEKGFLGGHAIVGSHIPLAAGRGLRQQVPRRGPGLHLLLRRRRHQSGGGPRGAQHGGALEAAGDLRRREQPCTRWARRWRGRRRCST